MERDEAEDAGAELLLALGRAFHESGVPSDQLEELMHDAAPALGLELQVMALPTSITAAIGSGYEQKVVLLRLQPGTIDLQRLALLNLVYERVLHARVAPRAALHEVARIAALRTTVGPFRTLLAYAILSVGAAVILGGGESENTVAAMIGLSTGTLAVLGRYVPAVDRLFEVLAAFVGTVMVTLYSRHVGPISVYIPIVAGVVQLLPGLQLTAALHELAYRNLVAGTSRLGSVLMTLLSLGCGFALGIAAAGPGEMHFTNVPYAHVSWYALAAAVFAVASAIAVLENARLQDYAWVLASCAVAELAYRLFGLLPAYQVSAFGAALVVGLVAMLGARYVRVPQAVLLIPGLLILVPGSLSYESILYVLRRDAGDAAGIAASAAISAVEIVAGLLLVQLFVPPPRRHGGRLSQPHEGKPKHEPA